MEPDEPGQEDNEWQIVEEGFKHLLQLHPLDVPSKELHQRVLSNKKQCYKFNSARRRARRRNEAMEKKVIRRDMIGTGKFGQICRETKRDYRSPPSATATKHRREEGLRIEGEAKAGNFLSIFF
jgi:hypothetical protein